MQWNCFKKEWIKDHLKLTFTLEWDIYVCNYVHVIYTHSRERERERREGMEGGGKVCTFTYTCIYSLFSLQDGLGKQINPIRGISSLQIASSQGGVACINVN